MAKNLLITLFFVGIFHFGIISTTQAQSCEGLGSQCGVAGTTCCAPYTCNAVPGTSLSQCGVAPARVTFTPTKTAVQVVFKNPQGQAVTIKTTQNNQGTLCLAAWGGSISSGMTNNASCIDAVSGIATRTFTDNHSGNGLGAYSGIFLRLPSGYSLASTPTGNPTTGFTQAQSLKDSSGTVGQAYGWPLTSFAGGTKTITITVNTPSPTPTPQNPKGSLDSVDCNVAVGWTCDASDYSAAIKVHIYSDADTANRKYLGETLANKPRESAVGAACGNGTSAHGYSFTLPSSIKDNKVHTITAYGLNIGDGNSNPALGGSPRTIQCAPPTATLTPKPTSSPTKAPTAVVTSSDQCALQPRGDANCDRVINDEDFTIWSKFFLGETYTGKQSFHSGDFNKDGKVSVTDIEIWRMNKVK